MSEKIPKAWWERSLPFVIVGALEALFFPQAVMRQLAVAAECDQAPVGSSQEEFPTLFPLAAHVLLQASSIHKK